MWFWVTYIRSRFVALIVGHVALIVGHMASDSGFSFGLRLSGSFSRVRSVFGGVFCLFLLHYLYRILLKGIYVVVW